MITISIRFLAGRYHATPWGRHVNEGAVEWPPSPWRILRAMIATWKRTLPSLPQVEVEPILRALAVPPEFLLPPVTTGHTRHFMPKTGPDDKTLVFDAFVVVPRGDTVLARWPYVNLTESERDILSRILANMGTLGRSESWCEASLVADSASQGRMFCPPIDGDLPRGCEIVRLLCPNAVKAFDHEHAVSVKTKTEGRGANRRTIEIQSSIYDPAWNICMETLQLHKERWSDPPGSTWVSYCRPANCFDPALAPSRRIPKPQQKPQFARYALDARVLPLVTDTLPIAELARRCLMGIYGRQNCGPNDEKGRSDMLSGKSANGEPLSDHRHAYFLPTDEDGDGRLDHLTVYAAEGFNPAEQLVLDKLSTMKRGDAGDIRLLLLGMAAATEFRRGPLTQAREWVSGTPYIATRFAKTRGRERVDMQSLADRAAFLEADLGRELARMSERLNSSLPTFTIEPLIDGAAFRLPGAPSLRPIQFKRFRQKRTDDGGRRPAGFFRITFDSPVPGPIALGHSSHFGMGLFLPANTDFGRGINPDHGTAGGYRGKF